MPFGVSFGVQKKYNDGIFKKGKDEYYVKGDPASLAMHRGGYVEPFGRNIPLLSNKFENYSVGGVFKWKDGEFDPFLNSLEADNKKVLLENGSLVVPKPVMNLYYHYIDKNGELKRPKIKNKDELVEVIVMPSEAVVPAKYVAEFKAYLKTYGVELPLKHQTYF
jgi:hypothetical protein